MKTGWREGSIAKVCRNNKRREDGNEERKRRDVEIDEWTDRHTDIRVNGQTGKGRRQWRDTQIHMRMSQAIEADREGDRHSDRRIDRQRR